MTTSGKLAAGVSGAVVVDGRWGPGPWWRLAIGVAKNGRFRVRYLIARRGLLHIRIALPDGDFLVGATRVS
jgi:hypothetical protein